MTQEKHTPGPWTCSDNRREGYWPYVKRGDAGGNVIQSQKSQENAVADARLMAAAPELFSSIKAILPIVDAVLSELKSDAVPFAEEVQFIQKIYDEAQAAIAKAKAVQS